MTPARSRPRLPRGRQVGAEGLRVAPRKDRRGPLPSGPRHLRAIASKSGRARKGADFSSSASRSRAFGGSREGETGGSHIGRP